MDLPSLLGDHSRHVLISLLIVVATLMLRSTALRAMSRSNLDVETQLRWRVQLRNVTLVVIVSGVIVVWADELRSVAISVAAVAAALVLATKELIMCLMGSMLRASGRSFHVGDRIEVTGIRGDVLDIGPLTTTVLEVGPGAAIHQRSGRKVTLPNSIFLAHAVTNETMSHDFVLHVLRVPMDASADWRRCERDLAEIASAHCARYVDDARAALAAASPDGVNAALISTEPAVYLEIPEPGRVELLLRFPAPARQRGRLAHRILHEFLERQQPEAPAQSEAPAQPEPPAGPSETARS